MAAGTLTFFIILSTLALAYVIVIYMITRGWHRTSTFRRKSLVPTVPTVSIIIAVRNESMTISKCIAGLMEQDFPKRLMEIIVVDDHSEDQTLQILNQLSKSSFEVKIGVLSLNELHGKKEAIRLAMQFASGSFILCTDADCTHPPGWVSTMAGFYEDKKPVFVSGPVLLDSFGDFFGRFQELEFMSLVASGAGAIGIGMPIMCNGANLGFSAEAYRSLNENAMKPEFTSGDDVFIMLAFREVFGSKGIAFVKSRDAIVKAEANRTIAGFFRQRMRWVSKSRGYRDPFLIFSAVTVMFMNSGILVFAVAGTIDAQYFILAIGLLLVKTITDFPLLVSFSRFAGMKNPGWIIPVFEPLVVLITAITALAGNFVRNSWKGRRIQ